jgi:hypothetical protein
MAAQAHATREHPENGAVATVRTVIVIDRDLPKGLAANAAAVLAHGFGSRLPGFVGADFDDAAGSRHAGLIPTGVPVLAAARNDLPALRAAALECGLVVVDFPAVGQQTTDYETFRAAVAGTEPADLTYLAVLVSGPSKTVRRLTGSLGLLR